MEDKLIPFEPSITDLVRQANGTQSKRIYQNDALAFASWINEQGKTLHTFSRSDFLSYKEHLKEKYQKATAARMLSIARRLLDEAVLHGAMASNPGKEVKGISVSNESTHIALTKQEARALLDSINTETTQGKRDYALITLLLRTGIRRTECAALNIGDFRIDGGHHTATIQHGKGDKRRTVKLPVDVFRAIKNYLDDAERANSPLDAPVFSGFTRYGKPTSRRLSDKRIEQIVSSYGAIALQKHLTPHSLRASFITLAIEGGAKLEQAQYSAGHSDPRTTERYHIRKMNLDDNAVDYIHL